MAKKDAVKKDSANEKIERFEELMRAFDNGETNDKVKERDAKQKANQLQVRYQELEGRYKKNLMDGADDEAIKIKAELGLVGDRLKYAEKEVQKIKDQESHLLVDEIRRIQEAADEAIKAANTGALDKLQKEAKKKKQEYEQALQELTQRTQEAAGVRRVASHLSKRHKTKTGVEIARVSRFTPDDFEVKKPNHVYDLPLG